MGWIFKNSNKELTQEEIVRKRSNKIVSISVAVLVVVMFCLFHWEVKNEVLASLIIATFALIAITAMIADADEVEIGPIKIKRRKKEYDKQD